MKLNRKKKMFERINFFVFYLSNNYLYDKNLNKGYYFSV